MNTAGIAKAAATIASYVLGLVWYLALGSHWRSAVGWVMIRLAEVQKHDHQDGHAAQSIYGVIAAVDFVFGRFHRCSVPVYLRISLDRHGQAASR
jgi:hypothetical protein